MNDVEKHSQRTRELWATYTEIRETKPELAKKLWKLIGDMEMERLEAKLRSDNNPDLRRYRLKRLREVHGENVELVDILSRTGLLDNKDVFIDAMRHYPVNYHGHICAYAADEAGEVLPWDEVGQAFLANERSKAVIEAFFTSTREGVPGNIQHAETEVVGGTQRSQVPFQVEVEGYPLRFLEQSGYNKLEVPVKGKSEVLRFPVHPESLVSRPEDSNRVPVWINVRQHNALVQCVCVPLVIVPKSGDRKKQRKKSK